MRRPQQDQELWTCALIPYLEGSFIYEDGFPKPRSKGSHADSFETLPVGSQPDEKWLLVRLCLKLWLKLWEDFKQPALYPFRP